MNLSWMVNIVKRKTFGAGFLFIAAILTWGSYAALDASDDVRITPLSITVTSDTSLPAEVKAQEAATIKHLFDRDTTTEFTAFASNTIHIQLDGAQSVDNFMVFGASTYRLSIRSFNQGSWQTINEWTNVDLTKLSAEWQSLKTKSAITAEALELTLIPSAAKGKVTASAAIKEMSFWGKSNRVLISNVSVLDNTLQQDSENIPAYTKSYTASPAEAVVSGQGASFNLDLPYAPSHIEKVWLSYDAYGVNNWVSAKRKINGHTAVGGDYQFTQSAWKTLYEPIHAQWLTQGSNTFEFSLPSDIAGSYRIRNLRLLVLLDDGAHFEQTLTASPQSSLNDVALSHDGDTDTGWQPFLTPTEKNTKPTLQINFEKSMQLDQLRLYALNGINGSINVDVLEGDTWVTGSNAIAGGQINSGWNTFEITSTAAAKALRLTFTDNGKSNLELREIVPVASGVGTLYEPNISVTYPQNGEYFGRSAYIRGYLNVEDNASGKANLFIGGKSITHDAGEFAALISKEDVQLSEQADDIAWQVTIEAVYPDGTKLTKIVTLNNYADNSETEGTLPHIIAKATPTDDNKLIEYDEASLELTEGAIDRPVEIKITSLKHDDLPALDPGMTNVTRGPRRGYRFTPHGTKFKKKIKITVPYDENLIPSGMTVADVKTYFFDEETGHWIPLEKVGIEKKKKRLISNTDHFTDMINATITVPDSPQAASFNPTQIKDIKAADPGAGINLIEPPQANNQGSANISYPIEIPAGRNGMQPQLAIQYNSGGGNGWLGLGWDLSVPSISIDTRWGVPRYKTDKESETYVLNGQQLSPVAHRSEQVLRTSNTTNHNGETVKIFHPRVEGSFQKIIRHGTSPSKYWWEVIDKNGTQNFYGSDGTEQHLGSIIGRTATTHPGVFKWMLRKSIDSNGNTVTYDYAQDCDTGTGTGTCSTDITGKQIYLKEVHYTGHGDDKGKYLVEFIRDSARSGYIRNKDNSNYKPEIDRRPDVSINATGGFKHVTSERLTHVNVKYNGSIVRSYNLNYTVRAFNKSLLENVIQLGADGSEFNRHEFDYHDSVTQPDNKLALFSDIKEMSVPGDNFALLGFPQTLVGGSLGVNGGFSGFFGIGPPLFGEDVHVAGTLKANASVSQTNISLIDIDGDGLADKVFERQGQVSYRKNTSDINSGTLSFSGEKKDISGINRLSFNESLSWGPGVKAQAFAANGYASETNTTTTDSTYFSDVNGDGLIDQIDNRTVQFGYLGSDGVPRFSNKSSDTIAPIGVGNINAEDLLSDMAAERKKMELDNPLMDAVRRWVVPYDGRINITGNVQLHNFKTDATLTDAEKGRRLKYETADGVRVSIQHNNTEIWAADINPDDPDKPNDYDPKSPAITYLDDVPALTQGRNVTKGQVLYFRVHSKYDGNYDRVSWVPTITYINSSTGSPLAHLDANQRNTYFYNVTNDFVLAGRPGRVVVDNYGTVKIEGQLQKTDITSDDVTLKIQLLDSIEDSNGDPQQIIIESETFEEKLNWNDKGIITVEHSMEVEKGQGISIKIESDSPIDLSKLQWVGTNNSPKIYYLSAYEPEAHIKQPALDPNQTSDSQLPDSADDVKPDDPDDMPVDGGILPRRDLPAEEVEKLVIYANYDADIYPGTTEGKQPHQAYDVLNSGVLLLVPRMELKTHPDTNCSWYDNWYECPNIINAPDGQVVFTVKRNGELLAKQTIEVVNKQVVASSQGFNALKAISVTAGDKLFFEFSARDPFLQNELANTQVFAEYGSNTAWKVPLTDGVNFRTRLYANMQRDSDGEPLPAKPVIFIARKGTEIIEKEELLVNSAYGSIYDHNFSFNIIKDEEYSFDYITIDPTVIINKHEVWSKYTGITPLPITKTGDIEVSPKLNFTSPANGVVTLLVKAPSQNWISKNYTVVAGGISDTQEPIKLSVVEGDSVQFVYRTSDHVLSSSLADKGFVSIDYTNQTKWKVPNNWAETNNIVSLSIQPQIAFSNSEVNGEVGFRVWRHTLVDEQFKRVLVASTDFAVVNGQAQSSNTLPLTINANSGEILGIEYLTDSAELTASVTSKEVVFGDGVHSANVSVVLNKTDTSYASQEFEIRMPSLDERLLEKQNLQHYAINDALYGNPYRNWSYIAYNSDHKDVTNNHENPELASGPLVTAQLRLRSEAEMKDPRSEHPAYLALPAAKPQRWESMDDNWAITRNEITSSRRGLDQINLPTAAKFKSTGVVQRIPRRSKANSFSAGGGAYFTVNYSTGTSKGNLDLIDLNGDRYPDMVGSGNVQYTNALGEMAETLPALNGTNVTETDGKSYSIGPSPHGSSPGARGTGQITGIRKPQEPDKGSVPFSAGVNSGNSIATNQLMDINGDGLPDQVIRSGSSISVKLNLGYDFAPEEYWGAAEINHSSTVGLSFGPISYTTNDGQKQLMDINGDGLVDKVVTGSNGQLFVSFNTGAGFGPQQTATGFLSTAELVPGGLDLPGPHTTLYDGASLSGSYGSGFSYAYTIWATFVPVIDLVWGGSASIGATVTQPTIGMRDMNGDGLVDGLRSVKDSDADVVVNQTGYTNMLKSVSRPLGGKFELEYKRTGNTYNLPQSRWVMSKVSLFDGVASDTPSTDLPKGSDYRAFKYEYQNGKHDRIEREFLGFANVVQEELNTTGVNLVAGTPNTEIFNDNIKSAINTASVFRVSNQTYLNDSFYNKGLLTDSETKGRQKTDGTGALVTYRKSHNDYVLHTVATGNSDIVIFPYVQKTENFFFEGGSEFKSSSTEFEYDDYGNVTLFKDLGEPNTTDDNVTAEIFYSHTDASCLAKNITAKPTQIIVTAKKDGVLKEVRKREADYYCSTTGNLKEVRQYLEDGSAAVTKLEIYDDFGNLKKVIGPANDGSSGNQRLTMLFDYDVNATNTYPVRITNDSYNIVSTASYDYKFGKPLCTLDVNGNPMAYQYDSFGRTSKITGPYELPEGYTCASAVNDSAFTIKFSYEPYVDLETPRKLSMAKTEHYNRDANKIALPTIDTWLFTDGVKRVLQTKKTSEVDQAGTVQVGQIVSGRVSFDALGRSVKQYYPTFETGAANPAVFNIGINPTQATVMQYDALDRNVSTILPDDTETTIAYDINQWSGGSLGNYFITTVTDANLKQKTTYRDVRELIHGVVEEGGLATTYKYDALKQITDVYDTENNHTHVEYDNLGRREKIDNPDTGLTQYKYDLASNLIEKITANRDGKVGIKYVYDFTRLKDIIYPTYPDNNVSYNYGDQSHKELNQAGRITEVTHQGGTDTREYGKLGEVTQEKRVLYVAARGTGDSAPVATYITNYDFDTFGRLMKLTLPDTEVITHGYNAGGSLNKISGSLHGSDYEYLKKLTYDKFEQRRSLTLGNGIQTQYHYDPKHRRLCRLESGLTLNQSANNAQDCETFPREVKSDEEQNALVTQMAGLTAAPKGQFQNINYAYDNVGNILGTANAVTIPRRSDMGGPTVQTFRYDDLYRLTKAKGQFSNAQSTQHRYDLAMQYSGIHNILKKTQEHTFVRNGGTPRVQRATTYDWNYTYKDNGHTQPHAPTHIGNRTFKYDDNGNQLGWDNDDNGQRRSIEWDDENRIQKIGDPKNTLTFAYDDSGTRVLKRGQLGQTAYVNQFFTVRNNALASKHIFAGTSRIATKLEPGAPVGTDPSNKTTDTSTTTFTTATTEIVTAKNKGQAIKAEKVEQRTFVERVTSFFSDDKPHPGKGVEKRNARANEVAQNTVKNKHLNGGTLLSGNNAGGNGNNGNNSNNGNDKDKTNNGNTDNNGGGIGNDPLANGGTFLYYYHPDHLGSTGYVTDEDAELYEHIEYFPFGETWISEAANSNQRVPYRYTSKEFDEETGLYYYGARYYDPRTSVWQSADPILGQYLNGEPNEGVHSSLNINLYGYVYQNPINYRDPTGKCPAGQIGVMGGGSAYCRDTQGFAESYPKTADAVGNVLGFFNRPNGRMTNPITGQQLSATEMQDSGMGVVTAAVPVSKAVQPVASGIKGAISGIKSAAAPHVQKTKDFVLNKSIAVHGKLTSISAAAYSKAVAVQAKVSAYALSAGIAVQGQIDKTTTAIGNAITRTGSAIQDLATRVWTSPVATNPAMQGAVTDFAQGALTSGPPPPTPGGAAGAVASAVTEELTD